MPALTSNNTSASSSALSGPAARTTYEPLSIPKGPAGSSVPKVILPVPIGNIAINTSKDIEAARSNAAFEPQKIEEIIRDGRIDNVSRKKIIDTLEKDEVFGDWKKRM